MSKSCPYCGNVVDDHIAKCPKCGLDFANRPAQPMTSTPSSPGGFPTAPDPFSSPGIWNPSKGQPVLKPVGGGNTGRRIAVVLASLLVVGGIAAGFFYVTREVTRNLDRPAPPVATAASEEPGPGNGNGNGKGGGPKESGPPTVGGSRELFRLMNQNGAKCERYNQVINTTTVDAAACFAGAEPWTIQVFFDDLSYDAVVSNYDASNTIDVAFGGNWTVIVQSKKSAKRIARAMDGDWSSSS